MNHRLSGKLNTSAGRMEYLDLVRGIAIIMVVGVHAIHYTANLTPELSRYISFIVHTISVPIFFLVDGFLFSKKISTTHTINYFEYLKRSAFRLLVPWLIFTLIYLLARYVYEYMGLAQEYVIVTKSPSTVLLNAYGSVFAGQMYFLVSLFMIRMLAPVFVYAAKLNNLFVQMAMFLGYVLIFNLILKPVTLPLHIEGGQEPFVHALWGLQFYFLGVLLYRVSMLYDLKLLTLPVGVLFVISLIAVYHFENKGLYLSLQFLYLLTIFFLATVINNLWLFRSIGENTMGIYLIHAPFILKGLSIGVNALIKQPLLSYVVLVLTTVIVSYYISQLLQKLPYGRVLFGMQKLKN